ncbi:CAAX amino terminal protease family protein [Aeromicrobium marinum DSM 15272]|uniref:CAAX amino terminal protease family protein n=1 Tax=Aeromicrobium marinum DSM 15272 TaxID=585531 RepID=E2S8W2_9ACTN|nr:CPBP family intramembrane glutamic endopeptidase [Aeromicrobium marinum]EFQ84617.1 CAAX amino terminal protease family protein [Aeromicrobium marinum DSM 15272]
MATRYDRQARETPQYAGWKLPVAGLVLVGAYLVGSTVVLLVAAAGFAAAGRLDDLDRWFSSVDVVGIDDPALLALDLALIGIALPAVLAAVLATGPRPVGYLSSVTGRLRWRWLGSTMLLAFVVLGLAIGAWALATGTGEDGFVRAPDPVDTGMLVTLFVVITFTPIQATAEEYVFRGYLMQLIGSWTRFAAVGVVVSSVLFVLAHAYDLWGQVDVGIFAVTAAILVLRTGGLEAAISLHVANNVILFALEAIGVLSTEEMTGDYGPVDLLPTVVSSVVFIGLVELMATRQGVQRTRPPLPPPPPPRPSGHWAAAWPAAGTQWSGQSPAPWPTQWPPAPPAAPPPPSPPRIPAGAPAYPGEIADDWGVR